MDNTAIYSLLKNILPTERILLDRPLANYTTFHIGGPADFIALPSTDDEVCALLTALKGVPHAIMGNGSNLLCPDEGYRGVVVILGRDFSQIIVDGTCITAQAGAQLRMVAKQALDSSLTGMECVAGIPGSFGGAVYMNAGAYGGEMKDIVISTRYADRDGNVHTLQGDAHEFGYRHSFFSGKDFVILSSTVQLAKGDPAQIKSKMDELAARRLEKQPLEYPSAGSTFKRPEGYFAGKLIEDAGLSGCQIGGAMVSPKHNGFVINAGGATCHDVLELISHIQRCVFEKFGVTLETEVQML